MVLADFELLQPVSDIPVPNGVGMSFFIFHSRRSFPPRTSHCPVTKHQSEIIDYQRRAQVGKSIGSGRMEKAVDQVIGHRQKHKGMSWRPQGSRALALLKVLELNGGWQKFWFPSTAQSSTNF